MESGFGQNYSSLRFQELLGYFRFGFNPGLIPSRGHCQRSLPAILAGGSRQQSLQAVLVNGPCQQSSPVVLASSPRQQSSPEGLARAPRKWSQPAILASDHRLWFYPAVLTSSPRQLIHCKITLILSKTFYKYSKTISVVIQFWK